MMKVAVLASGAGTNLQALLDTVHGRDGIEIVAVASDKEDARALQRAREAGVATASFPITAYDDRDARDHAMGAWLLDRGADLVVLAGYMALLSAEFLTLFPVRVINVHPALLPAFPGLGAVQQALDYGVRVFGVTVHFVDEGVDSGPIILQRAISLPEVRDAEEVLERLHPIEHELLPEAVRLIARGAVSFDAANPRRVTIAVESDQSMEQGIGSAAADFAPVGRGEVQVARALLSVSDKTGIAEFARGLSELGIEIVSTGGTAQALASAGVAVREVSDLTGFPEIMGGRVKTLHPKLHAGLLAVRDDASHLQAADEHGVEFIDLVCVNLYPFERRSGQRGVLDDEVIENIDIGGPRRREELRFHRARRHSRELRRHLGGAARVRSAAADADPGNACRRGVCLHGPVRHRSHPLVSGEA
jgi:formyltetrahydrofolate-dependent phosphoribosylglycinamide formyltransferase